MKRVGMARRVESDIQVPSKEQFWSKDSPDDPDAESLPFFSPLGYHTVHFATGPTWPSWISTRLSRPKAKANR